MADEIETPKVFLGMPHYSGLIQGAAAQSFYGTPTLGGVRVAIREEYGTSALAKSFNVLWSRALRAAQGGHVTHFAMIHADVGAEDGWLDKLWRVMQEELADVVSAVIPIKDGKGVTSTGIDDPADPFEPLRRFTLREVHGRLPATFDNVRAGYPENALLINTGLWLADIRGAWATAVDDEGRLLSAFTMQDEVRLMEGGQYRVGMNPEDWNFSRYLHRAGAKYVATSKVIVAHVGEAMYRNDYAWGKYETDEDTAHKWRSEAGTATGATAND